MNRNETVSELERLIRMLEMIILNFGLEGEIKLSDPNIRLDMVRLLEFLSELRK